MRKEYLFLLCCWVWMVACIPIANEAEPIAGSQIEIERATVTATSTTQPEFVATAIPSPTPTYDPYNTLTLTPTPGPYPTRTPYVTPPPPPTMVTPPEGYVSPPNCVVPDDWVMYTVQEGDTAYNLVLNTGTDLSTFYTINCMVFGSPIILGQEIALPTYPVVQEDTIISPELVFFSISPDQPTLEDNIELSWQLNGVESVQLYGIGMDLPPMSPTDSYMVSANELVLDEWGCVNVSLYATAVNTSETYTQSICFVDLLPISNACITERLTTDPTLPEVCPTLAPVEAQAFVQSFENGFMMGYAYGEAGAYQLLVSQGVEAYIYNDTYVGDGDLNARVGHALATYPEIQDLLGEPIGDLQLYTTRWQEVDGHYVVVMPDGSLARYLIYDGNYGQWIPISEQWNPNG